LIRFSRVSVMSLNWGDKNKMQCDKMSGSISAFHLKGYSLPLFFASQVLREGFCDIV